MKLWRFFLDSMSSAAFAEAGEFDTARQMLPHGLSTKREGKKSTQPAKGK